MGVTVRVELNGPVVQLFNCNGAVMLTSFSRCKVDPDAEVFQADADAVAVELCSILINEERSFQTVDVDGAARNEFH